MRKQFVDSRRLRLLPIAAGLLMALAHASAAQAQSDGRRSMQFLHHEDEAVSDLLSAIGRSRRPSSLPQEPAWRKCRTTVVRNCNDHGSGSLRDAVSGAGSGDTIDLGQLHCSAITLTSGAIDIAVDDLTITGSSRHALRIDGNHADRVFNDTGVGTLTVTDLKLTHGRSDATGYNQGGCLSTNGALTLKRVRITGCEVVSDGIARGGALYAYGQITIKDSSIDGNSAHGGTTSVGGGIFGATNAVVTDTLIGDNAAALDSDVGGVVATGGGALVLGDFELIDSVVSGNSATASTSFPGTSAVANGAGVLAIYTIRLTRSTVSDNAAQAINTASDALAYSYAYSFGGGVRAGTLASSDSTVSGNSTSAVASNPLGIAFEASRGAGFSSLGAENVIGVINSTISGNTSSRSESALLPYGYSVAGGIWGYGGTLDLSNSTVAFNAAEIGGGMFQYTTSGASAESSIVANNSFAAGNSDFDVGSAMSLAGANNLVMSSSVDLTLPGGTLTADPKLAPLADNGGTTLTHALRSGSPAINAGNNVAGLRFDQRGHGYPRKVGHATDIGAFEKR